jgi:Ca-activated chloride channel family protein
MTPMLDWPWFLPVAVALSLAIAAFVVIDWRRRRARLTTFSAPHLLQRLVPVTAWRRPAGRALRLSLSALFAFVALAGPRWGEEQALVRGEGVDLVLALDASLSMMATDERPSRLERMKQEVRRFRAQSGGDRIALLAFAGRSYILTPLTVDDGALELFLDNLDPSIVGQAGSSLARTITQGVDLLQATQGTGDRALILMSDGEAFEPEADVAAAARHAGEAGIPIIAVGFGTEQGSTIPLREGDRIVPKRDEEGLVVISRYNPLMLRSAADESHGTFIDASESDKATRIRQTLRSLKASGRTVQSGREFTRRFQLFLIPALLLLLFDTWWSDRSTRRVLVPVALLLLLSAQGCVWRNDPSAQGARAYRNKNFSTAVTLFRTPASDPRADARAFYNFGTALVAADSDQAALEPLERAVRPEPNDLRFRSLFNYGLARLKRGLGGEGSADTTRTELAGALDAYKRALLMRSGDLDAKWNYELALRKKKSGGGGGGGGSSPNSAQQPDRPQSERPSGGLGEQQAEQLLNSAARDERGVQGKKQKQTRPPPRGGRDW